MEIKTREQEAMNPMSMNMNPAPLNNLRGYHYFFPDYQAIQNCPPMSMYNNLQPMNGYPYQMEFIKEEPPINAPTTPEKKNIPKNQNTNSANQEKQKAKPYINFLINTVTNLMNEGKITMKYLKEKTELKSSHSNCNRNSPDCSSSPSLPTMSSYKRANNEKLNNIKNTLNENGQCEKSFM